MRLTRRLFVPAALAGAAGIALAACGGGSVTVTNSPTTVPANAAGGVGGGARGPNGERPAATGQLAAVTGNVLEVQDPSTGQVTVDLTASTVITQTAPSSSSALQTGQCVTAAGTKDSAGGVTAASVEINLTTTTPDCSGGLAAFGGGAGVGGGGFGGGGFGGGGGGRGQGGGGGGGGTTRTTLSQAQIQQRLATLGISTGKVTAINGSTVDVQVPPQRSTTTTPSNGGNGPRIRVTPLPKFTFSGSTQFNETKTAAPSDLTVGQCVTAFGTSDNTGTVTATRLIVRPAGPNGCGGGRFFTGGGAGGPGGQLSAPAGSSGAVGPKG